MRTHRDLTLNEYDELAKMTKRLKITIGEAQNLLPVVMEKFELDKKEAFEAMKKTKDEM